MDVKIALSTAAPSYCQSHACACRSRRSAAVIRSAAYSLPASRAVVWHSIAHTAAPSMTHMRKSCLICALQISHRHMPLLASRGVCLASPQKRESLLDAHRPPARAVQRARCAYSWTLFIVLRTPRQIAAVSRMRAIPVPSRQNIQCIPPALERKCAPLQSRAAILS